MNGRFHPPVFKEMWPRNHRELQRHNFYCYSCYGLHCPASQLYLLWSREYTSEKNWKITLRFYFSNHRRSTFKIFCSNTFVCRLFQGIWFYTQRKDGANTCRIWYTQRNCYCYSTVVRSSNSDTDFLEHCHWSLTRTNTSTISIYNLLRSRTTNSNISNERKFQNQERPEDDISLKKLLLMQTTQMTYWFLQIHQDKPNLCSNRHRSL